MLGKSVQEIAIKPIQKDEYDPNWKYDWETAQKIISSLVENQYVVMTSLEEKLIIINYTYGCDIHSDRNEVAFMSLDELEDNYYQIEKESE